MEAREGFPEKGNVCREHIKKHQRENKEMKKKEEGRKTYGSDWRRWCYGEGRRRGGIGFFLIIIGGLWLGAELEFFNSTMFWPLVFIAVGTWIIVASLLGEKSGNRSK